MLDSYAINFATMHGRHRSPLEFAGYYFNLHVNLFVLHVGVSHFPPFHWFCCPIFLQVSFLHFVSLCGGHLTWLGFPG